MYPRGPKECGISARDSQWFLLRSFVRRYNSYLQQFDFKCRQLHINFCDKHPHDTDRSFRAGKKCLLHPQQMTRAITPTLTVRKRLICSGKRDVLRHGKGDAAIPGRQDVSCWCDPIRLFAPVFRLVLQTTREEEIMKSFTWSFVKKSPKTLSLPAHARRSYEGNLKHGIKPKGSWYFHVFLFNTVRLFSGKKLGCVKWCTKKANALKLCPR